MQDFAAYMTALTEACQAEESSAMETRFALIQGAGNTECIGGLLAYDASERKVACALLTL